MEIVWRGGRWGGLGAGKGAGGNSSRNRGERIAKEEHFNINLTAARIIAQVGQKSIIFLLLFLNVNIFESCAMLLHAFLLYLNRFYVVLIATD